MRHKTDDVEPAAEQHAGSDETAHNYPVSVFGFEVVGEEREGQSLTVPRVKIVFVIYCRYFL